MNRFMPVAMAIAIGTTAPFASSTAVTAAILTWDLTFWDTAGVTVGTGEFSYDDEILTFVQTHLTTPTDGFTVHNALTHFAATVLGKDWDLRDRPGVSWWHPVQSNSLGQQRISRSGLAIADSWFFGDPFLGTRQLLIEGGQHPNNQGWGGSWLEYVLNSTTPPTMGNGTWAATPRHQNQTAVPEPTTVVGTVLFGVGGWIGKKALAHRASRN